MKSIKDTKKLLIIACIALSSVVCLYALLIFEVKNKIDLVEEHKNNISERVKKANSLRFSQKMLEDTKKNRGKLTSYFISKEGTVDFIDFIESLGESAGFAITIESVDLLREEDGSYADLLMTVSGEGDWQDFMHFFTLLESMPYKVEIQKMNSEANLDKNGDASFWRGKIKFTVSKLK